MAHHYWSRSRCALKHSYQRCNRCLAEERAEPLHSPMEALPTEVQLRRRCCSDGLRTLLPRSDIDGRQAHQLGPRGGHAAGNQWSECSTSVMESGLCKQPCPTPSERSDEGGP